MSPATFKPQRWVGTKEVDAVTWPGGKVNANNIIWWLGQMRWHAEYGEDPEQGEFILADTYGPPKRAYPGWVFVWDGVGVRVYNPASFRRNFKRVTVQEYRESTPQEA